MITTSSRDTPVISEPVATAEGVMPYAIYGGKVASWKGGPDFPAAHDTAYGTYRGLWDSLNAERGLSWAANPWVWVVEFKNSRHSTLDHLVEDAEALGLYDMEQTR
ncbi:hypothetical protein [Burkholderia gladioli]|uniref:hypothetical protein n=1 Tax=Burkholderia gladioli TaxID=28095 RepID=UPI00163E4D32|nr:hypothetical protein [Burkholderia gladioli]